MTTTLFQSHDGVYASYRIPALLSLPTGRVLAFCEGRVNNDEDYGEIHTLLRISEDGRTFRPQRVIARMDGDTVGNNTPVFDRDTGRIFLFLNHNPGEAEQWMIDKNRYIRRILMMYSDDLGDSWSDLIDLTDGLRCGSWTWYACGPCHALQLRSGRIVIPCCHGVYDAAEDNSAQYRTHMVFSDDHGETWRLGADLDANTNETTVAELPDGRLFLSARHQEPSGYRVCAYSTNGGESWQPSFLHTQLPDPRCQASVLYDDCRHRLLHLNNPHPFLPQGGARRDITLKESADGGNNWHVLKQLCDTPSAYGDIAVLGNGHLACLYECGEDYRYDRIDYLLLES